MTPEMILAKMLSTPSTTVEKTASAPVPDESATLEKLAWADEMGRELAREHMEKKAVALPGAVSKGIGHAMGALTTSSGVKRGLVGAGVGAVGGAMKDPGQGGSRLGNMAVGAGLGAGAGVASGALARSAGSMNNVVGKTLGGAQTAVAKQTGNMASMAQSKNMASARGAAQRTSAANPFAGGKPAAVPKTAPAPAAIPAPKPATPAGMQPRFGATLDQARMGKM